MTCRVEKDAERRARLVLGLGCSQLEHCVLGDVEIVDHDVDVHLLGHILAWPLRRAELLDPLEADALVAGFIAHLSPAIVRGRLPIEQGAVELGEAAGVVAVENNRGEACN